MNWNGSQNPRRRLAISWLLLVLSIAVFVLALLLPLNALGLTAEEEALQKAYESGQIIRLHILAEDDTPHAQQTKLAVRDAVLAAFGGVLAQAGEQDAQAVYTLLGTLQPQLLRVAQETARACGFDGTVAAETGLMHLPEKTYGNVVLPAGEYRALRITIGKGEGQNWWCVLFPRLCLALASDGETQAMPAQELPPLQVKWHSLDLLRLWPLCPAEEAAAP